ncbi:PREDICTED: ubiquitin carboxyl-terminal hydrolase FAM188A-like isoform X2 [Lupinus angustifolius]|uniref:ubiquitin carboxyl-terminal hydrolase FAM188A-like isoform X2 n=1 Tax=Lupinus angustifolius TaxID=3871 RepID=UPI00092F9764|nr:PREDICTED: ubiquitin carboxyl-terminal hydrolase FAM188A-like isoform X2 [Lupinus angustifolius]
MGEDEELEMAIQMSMQPAIPEDAGAGALSGDSGESLTRRRELMAAAAEKRLSAAAIISPSPSPPPPVGKVNEVKKSDDELCVKDGKLIKEVSVEEANELFVILFGSEVSKGILARWCNQGIRFSSDPATSMGLVQHEGGPCGVLAAIQAFVLKYILFFSDDLKEMSIMPHRGLGSSSRSQPILSFDFASLSEDVKLRALVRSMGEILFSCGSNRRVVIATMSVSGNGIQHFEGISEDEGVVRSLEGLSIDSALDLQKVLRVETYTSQTTALQRLEANIALFQSRVGALLFLISALLSRGLDLVQSDRDDPSLPLVTAPFGHASQEIVNLLLCGEAVPNVFDGRMDLGGGMFLKGISRNVEVGFLTLLESLNFCKVGQFLKTPKWPIWVVGSESHYTVLFALDLSVQNENELEVRETQIRKAFDAQDQSGGGGFISGDGFHQVLRATNIKLPQEKAEQLSNTEFIVWSEFWQVILDLDKSLGGLKDSSGLMGKKAFDLYHFNGIAKSDLNGIQVNYGGETPLQKPRLTKLRVSVPPRWTHEEFMASGSSGKDTEVSKPEPSQHAPLVDCIKTRWARAVCTWSGDPPSIV